MGETKDKFYAMLDDGKKEIVRISVASIEPLLRLIADPEGLRDRTLVKAGALDKPDAITLKNSYGNLEFQRIEPAKPWMLYRPGKDVPDAINEVSVTNLISVFGQKGQIKSFLDAPAKDSDLELDKPLAELSIYIDGIDKTPKKKSQRKRRKTKLKKTIRPKTRRKRSRRKSSLR